MRAAPPTADGYLDGSKEHTTATAIVDKEIVPAVTGTDASFWQVMSYFHFVLQALNLHILFQQTVLRCGIQG